MGCGPESEAN
ncbi:hypothetical protein CAEBREN_16056 [Caenorhabditis brenneri]|uniref:Uncharacterized protein n=1 Tax=Caenorhabditis brenneri TaxID=135651 RepID=G0NL02_CAEBE|nr:hypothetical protein CAEBREN_16056 [Caenorhabditis brenneri]